MSTADLSPQRWLDQQMLYGGRFQRFIREWLMHSGIFWLFDMLRQMSLYGASNYVLSLPHWVLFGTGAIQAWIISYDPRETRWWHYFIAPSLYTLIDVRLEGISGFLAEPYHILYWLWLICVVSAHLIERKVSYLATLLKSFLLVMLLPSAYMLAEWNIAQHDLWAYWVNDPSHLFILLGTSLLGVSLGITTIMRDRFETFLYQIAHHLEHIASWSFDTQLIGDSYTHKQALDLQRQFKAVLFMDIRGFTPWSEAHSARQVVDMVN